MVIDAAFAYVHFLAIGCLVAVLTTQTVLINGDIGAAAIARLARIDIGLGLSAVVILLAGAGRVGLGLKGAAYYMGNAMFWVKIALFFGAGLASVPPTLTFIAWRKALRADGGFRPAADALTRVRMFIRVEWFLLALIPFAAAMMARDLP